MRLLKNHFLLIAILFLSLAGLQGSLARGSQEENILGPQSKHAIGEQHVLVLKVNLDVMEGSGTVKVMDADPDSPYFSHATFRLDRNNRNAFIDKKNNVAIIPLWSDKGTQGVLITTPEKSSDALKAALMIQKLFQRFPEPRGKEEGRSIEECIASFKRSDFKTCCQVAQQALK